MRADYRRWLQDQGYPETSVATRIANANKVEKLYGNLEQLFAGGGYQALIDGLTYSTEDARLRPRMPVAARPTPRASRQVATSATTLRPTNRAWRCTAAFWVRPGQRPA